LTAEGLLRALPNYLAPDEYQRRYPDTPPGKYLIRYSCTGLLEPEAEGDEPLTSNSHMMTVIFGYDFPAKPPILIWYTPIWHPNFATPHVCTQGRPFSAGVSLNRIVLTVGEMIQYRNYNLADPLNLKAREWAQQNTHLFPVDNRDLVDSRYRYKTRAGAEVQREEPLVELVGPSVGAVGAEDRLVEFTD
jgi:ubiquitin-protein ligase